MCVIKTLLFKYFIRINSDHFIILIFPQTNVQQRVTTQHNNNKYLLILVLLRKLILISSILNTKMFLFVLECSEKNTQEVIIRKELKKMRRKHMKRYFYSIQRGKNK